MVGETAHCVGEHRCRQQCRQIDCRGHDIALPRKCTPNGLFRRVLDDLSALPTSPYPAIFPRANFPSRPSLSRRRPHTSKSTRQAPHRTRESPQKYPQVRHPFRLSTLWRGQVLIRTLGLTARGGHLRGRQRCQARLAYFAEKPLRVRGSEIVVFRKHTKRGTEDGGKQ